MCSIAEPNCPLHGGSDCCRIPLFCPSDSIDHTSILTLPYSIPPTRSETHVPDNAPSHSECRQRSETRRGAPLTRITADRHVCQLPWHLSHLQSEHHDLQTRLLIATDTKPARHDAITTIHPRRDAEVHASLARDCEISVILSLEVDG